MNNSSKQNSSLFKHMEDVREFQDKLHDISKTWDQLILFSQLGATGMDMSQTKTNFNKLTDELSEQLGNSTLNKVVNEMKSKSQVAVDIVIRNLFERTADIGFLATDDDIRNFLLDSSNIVNKTEQDKIKERFEEYVAKYSVYYDIVLFNTAGEIVAKLDENNTIAKTCDEIINSAKNTSQEYLETYKYHDFLPEHKKSLVYTFKVTKTNECDDIIGYLSLCFKFENEMEEIFSRLIEKKNKETILLLDKDGVSIASSDMHHIPVGVKLEVEVEKPFGITSFAGRDYIIKTCLTNGYEGFFGLGWMGHIMIPLSSAFISSDEKIDIEENILHSIMQNENIFQKELYEIPHKASVIQEELDRTVWNGNVSQNDPNATGAEDFSRSILREVRQTGEKTKITFNDSIGNLNETIISSLLENAIFLSSLSIDIMDRNLYERANDCRWWALTSNFQTLLDNPTIEDEAIDKITNILQYINELYTVYTNLFIYDKDGTILAVSNQDEKSIIGKKLTNKWITQTLNLKNSSKYSVSPFEKTDLYDNNYSYIYGASIFSLDRKSVVGGIGVVFDSQPQFKDMLNDALPQSKNDMFSLFVEKESKKIISCSNENYTIGDTLALEECFYELKEGETLSKIIQYNDKYYIVGATASSGYREYKGNSDEYINDIIAFVFIEAGEIKESVAQQSAIIPQYYEYTLTNEDIVQNIATFYIGDKWVGIQQSQVVEAVGIENLETPISMETEHYLKGTICYKDYLVSVLDISEFIKNQDRVTKSDIVIVNYDGSDGKHTLGIVIDSLGEIMNIPLRAVKAFDNHMISGGMIAQSIVQPPENTKSKNLLTILNIEKLTQMTK